MGSRPDFQPIGRAEPDERTARLGGTVRSEPGDAAPGRQVNPRVALVQGFPLFANISPHDCAEIVATASHREYSRGQTIHIEGDPVRRLVLLISGAAKVIQSGQNGSAVILRFSGPGELVGTLARSSLVRHCGTAQACGSSTTLIWDLGVFECFARRLPALGINIAHILTQQLLDIQERFREISTERVAARLSRQMARLMNQVGIRGSGTVMIAISREELAQLTGTTLFTVSRLLSEWDRQGIVKARREAVSILNRQALEEICETTSRMALKG
jgi:CRP-like cAMP-binding protein